MTPAQIDGEIKRRSREKQAAATRLVYQLDAERKLNGPELAGLAERFVNEQNSVEASRVHETILRGFYGAEHDT